MIDGVSYLGAAMAESPSYVFKWNGAAFEEFQILDSSAIPFCHHWPFFFFGSQIQTKYWDKGAHVKGLLGKLGPVGMGLVLVCSAEAIRA